ncbi:hypothetical protein FDA94_09580 [Herbidospora galbida]|uniref:Uncharacterized protein n=1 Tax=Herbidospora galbida TaxID=2575442 RepID=A0A4V5V1F2_9ACTN|nr:hypothetical protein [Herbidospora galbida]TKK89623.1 hypothetical protein FDA94_09580 [Herbidospora galbida]
MPTGLRELSTSPWRDPTFWWWIAVMTAVQPALYSVTFEFLQWAPGYDVVPIACPSTMVDEPTSTDRVEWFARGIGDDLTRALPLLFLLPILGLRKTGTDEAHLRAARWAFVVALTAVALVSLDLNPVPLDECTMRQFGLTPRSMSLTALLTWAQSPILPLLVAGAVAAQARPGWSVVALPLAAVLVIAALPIVKDRAAKIYLGPALTADGTHRYALLNSYAEPKNWSDGTGELYVVDLTTGRISDVVWPPRSLDSATFTAVTRDREAGHYVTAVLGPRGRSSRLHRLTVNADGKAMLRESLTPPLAGIVAGVAVSGTGRVAYGRAVDVNGVRRYFTGAIGPKGERPSEAPDVLTRTSPTEIILPDGRHLAVHTTSPTRTIGVHRGDRKLATILTAGNRIMSMALDATGTALLVGMENPQPLLDSSHSPDYQIVRVDLRALNENPEAAGDLNLPRHVVWEGREPPADLAW